MTAAVLLLATLALVAVVVRILGVGLRRELRAAHPPTPLPAEAPAAPAEPIPVRTEAPPAEPTPLPREAPAAPAEPSFLLAEALAAPEVEAGRARASWRLLFALLLIAAGAALFIAITIRWVGSLIERIVS